MLDYGGSSSSITSFCSTSHFRTTINGLLRELQQIWSEIGEAEADKGSMLLELERECVEVYRRKVDEAANAKARLHQAVAAQEAEFATLMAALGEVNINSPIQSEKNAKSLKEQLTVVTPLIEELKQKKEERMKQFANIKAQINKISVDLSGYGHVINAKNSIDSEEQELSLRKLSEYQSRLRVLQKEKSERLEKVLERVNEVHSLCGVLAVDFGKTVSDIHPSLKKTDLEQSTNISDATLEGLDQAILRLKTERKVRLHKLKDVAVSLFELWKLMDTTEEEKSKFPKVTSILESSLEINEPGVLSLNIIQQASAEVERLTKLKASRMKELVMKRRLELEEICLITHIRPDPSTAADKANAMIDSGLVDACELLSNIEAEISKVKDEALSRKEILDRLDRWLSACEEENWLEEYSKDENRYSAGRGVHINLKRAERARITVNKIPVMVDSLINKSLAWEAERKKLFIYDGVRLVSILEDYKLTRKQKEDAKKRAKDQKRLHDMLLVEKEAMYGSRPSPRKSNSFKTNGYHASAKGSMTPSPRRYSLGNPAIEPLTPRTYCGRKNGHFKDMRRLSTGPLNFVPLSKEETMSFSSVCGSEPESPPQS